MEQAAMIFVIISVAVGVAVVAAVTSRTGLDSVNGPLEKLIGAASNGAVMGFQDQAKSPVLAAEYIQRAIRRGELRIGPGRTQEVLVYLRSVSTLFAERDKLGDKGTTGASVIEVASIDDLGNKCVNRRGVVCVVWGGWVALKCMYGLLPYIFEMHVWLRHIRNKRPYIWVLVALKFLLFDVHVRAVSLAYNCAS